MSVCRRLVKIGVAIVVWVLALTTPLMAQSDENLKVADGLTLTAFSELSARTAATRASHNDVPAWQKSFEITGVTLDFRHPPAGQADEQFNLMLASGDLADVIYRGWLNFPGGPEKALGDGYIIPLNDLIDQYAPHLQRYLEENSQAARNAKTDSGRIYMVPFIRGAEWQRFFWGPQIRKDWLDAVGMTAPTTIEEWGKMLEAFKTQNPSGRDDAYPLVAQGVDNLAWFSSAWGLTYDFYQVDGEVHYGPAEPGFKELLTVLREWYEKGYIDPDFPSTTTRDQITALVTSNRAGAYWAVLNGQMGVYLGLMQDHPTFDLVGAPWPMTEDGKVFNFHPDASRGVTGSGAAISSTNEHPVETIKYLDFWWSETGHNLGNFGFEGLTYNWVDGYPKYTDLILNNPEGLPPAQALSKYSLDGGSGRAYVQDGRYFEQVLKFPSQRPAADTWAQGSIERTMPAVTPTPEESRRLASIMTEVETYRDEMIARFVLGRESLDNFDEYLARLDQMGIDEAIEIKQAAIERYFAR